jgi:hypothetical protein
MRDASGVAPKPPRPRVARRIPFPAHRCLRGERPEWTAPLSSGVGRIRTTRTSVLWARTSHPLAVVRGWLRTTVVSPHSLIRIHVSHFTGALVGVGSGGFEPPFDVKRRRARRFPGAARAPSVFTPLGRQRPVRGMRARSHRPSISYRDIERSHGVPRPTPERTRFYAATG